MLFYRIRIKSFPKIRFAHTFRTQHFANAISRRQGCMEITVSDANLETTEAGEIRYYPSKSCHLTMPDMDISSRTTDPDMRYFTNVSMNMDFEYERFDTEDPQEIKRIAEEFPQDLLLPVGMELGADYTGVEGLLRQITFLSPRETAAAQMKAVALWSQVLAQLDEKFRRSILDKKESLTLFYSKKAKKYIENHYQEKLKVGDIAQQLKITPNYLSNLFCKETGQTVMEYVYQVRLDQARKLLYEENADPEQIARAVGVRDARYLNELFVKYYGSSLHKCILADREISLYFNKSWEKTSEKQQGK